MTGGGQRVKVGSIKHAGVVSFGDQNTFVTGSAAAVEGGARLPRPTVGIVTALPEEYGAVCACLDDAERHRVEGDPAEYTIGTMPSADRDRPHTVVAMQAVQPGNAPAAAACTSLTRSFPTVDVVVMAGIAAGVPRPHKPERHVRLGDVAVAYWGVVDYDHITNTPRGARPRGGFPQPSPLLLRAANALRADELTGQRPWETCLAEALRRPDMAGFARPEDTNTYPTIHYGLVGSADRSLRNARVRDRIAERHDVWAIEMEGSGIGRSGYLNGVEWFVVRGISDYGDGATSRLWRPYAALAAAAYVRALLGRCAVTDPGAHHAEDAHA